MTYRKLREYFNRLSQEQLDIPVVLYDTAEGEFFTLDSFIGNWEDFPDGKELAEGILEDNHPFLMF